jgi:coenzyme F420-reducing hydrogenase beta subunit
MSQLYPIQKSDPAAYFGEFLSTGKGHDANWHQRTHCASGGMVTRFLSYLLEKGEIQGAVVSITGMDGDQPHARSSIATTIQEIEESATSIYLHAPVLKLAHEMEAFPGRLAVVATPCVATALRKLMICNETLKSKIRFIFGLYCGGVTRTALIPIALKKAKCDTRQTERLIFRSGLWRGTAKLLYQDGMSKAFSYKKYIFPYKNAYFFAPLQCMTCEDHFAREADISFGDVWLTSEKGGTIKKTGYINRNLEIEALLAGAIKDGVIHVEPLSPANIIKSQYRPLVFKYGLRRQKEKAFPKHNFSLSLNSAKPARLTHRLAFRLALINMRFSQKHPRLLAKIPVQLIYGYMAVIRLLLN